MAETAHGQEFQFDSSGVNGGAVIYFHYIGSEDQPLWKFLLKPVHGDIDFNYAADMSTLRAKYPTVGFTQLFPEGNQTPKSYPPNLKIYLSVHATYDSWTTASERDVYYAMETDQAGKVVRFYRIRSR